jgi:hypothetical protein
MSDRKLLDNLDADVEIARMRDLRNRFEALATDAAAVAEDAEQLKHRLRDQAQWLALLEEQRLRRHQGPRRGGCHGAESPLRRDWS